MSFPARPKPHPVWMGTDSGYDCGLRAAMVGSNPQTGHPSMMQPSTSAPPSRARAFLNDQYSDMKIICGGKTFPAHKVVLCMGSKWFAIDGAAFKESSGEINLDDRDPILIERVLEFLYKGDYSTDGVALNLPTPNTNETSSDLDQVAARKRKGEPLEEAAKKYQKNSSGDGNPIDKEDTSEEEADYFMIDDLVTLAYKNFDLELYAIGSVQELEVLIRELWSGTANYKTLQSLFLRHQEDRASEAWRLFLRLPPAFFKSMPHFAVDFCLDFVEARWKCYLDTSE